jgi:hypothetical protein
MLRSFLACSQPRVYFKQRISASKWPYEGLQRDFGLQPDAEFVAVM